MKHRLQSVPNLLVQIALLLELRELAWANALFLLAIKHLFVPVLVLYLQFKFSELADLKLVIRQSGTNPSDYNLLFSDVDLYVLLPNKATDSQIGLLAKSLAKIRSGLLFLGEFEIYRLSEHQELELLLSRSQLYHQLRDVRKLGWLARQQSSLPSRFHRERNLRAMRKCYGRLGLKWAKNQLTVNFTDIAKFLDQLLTKLPYASTPEQIDEFCPYLGFRIIGADVPNSNSDQSELHLLTGSALSLLACTPPKTRGAAIQPYVNSLRRDSEFHKKIFAELCLIEMLTVIGVNRGMNPPESGMLDWEKSLRESCSLSDPRPMS